MPRAAEYHPLRVQISAALLGISDAGQTTGRSTSTSSPRYARARSEHHFPPRHPLYVLQRLSRLCPTKLIPIHSNQSGINKKKTALFFHDLHVLTFGEISLHLKKVNGQLVGSQ